MLSFAGLGVAVAGLAAEAAGDLEVAVADLEDENLQEAVSRASTDGEPAESVPQPIHPIPHPSRSACV